MPDRYAHVDLAPPWKRAPEPDPVEAERDLVVEEVTTGWCGAVVRTEADTVDLEDRHGRVRTFPLGTGFLLDGRPVRLVRPRGPGGTARPTRTRSGSVAVPGHRARVARAARILVEGVHDAELVEKVWGDDLRVEGVVVERLDGADDLAAVVRDFGPGPGRRLGVLLDHLVTGSKETRLAAQIAGAHVLVVGHPYVDVWQAVRPQALGLTGWPSVPKGQPWKEGVLAALGWPGPTGAAWRRILAAVGSYADLEPALLGRVEELIDFVTAQDDHGQSVT